VLNDPDIQQTISQSFKPRLVSLDTALIEHPSHDPIGFVQASVPESIFSALASGKMIQVVLSGIMIGVAMGYLKGRLKHRLIDIFDMLQKPFQVLSSLVFLWLPLGLLLNLAGSFSPLVLLAVWRFLVISAASFFVVIGLCLWFMAWWSGMGFSHLVARLKDPMVLVFSTKQEFIAIPWAVRFFSKDDRLHSSVFSCVVPAGMSLFCFGRIFYYGVILMSVSAVYKIDYSLSSYFVCFLSVFLAAAAGDQIEDTIPPMFQPLGLPAAYGVAFFPIIDWAFEPLRAMLSFTTSCALGLLASQRPKKRPKKRLSAKKLKTVVQGAIPKVVQP
jgi:proton glutamate symport protein